jgi:hypothetical protein
MKDATKELLKRVAQNHDWESKFPEFDADPIASRNIFIHCRVFGLMVEYYQHKDHKTSTFVFRTMRGQEIAMLEAAHCS